MRFEYGCALLLIGMVEFGAAAMFDDMVMLRKTLFENYTTHIRPSRNLSEALEVKMKVKIEGITGVNDVEQIIGYNIVFVLEWEDDFLMWNPQEYGDIDHISPMINEIWHPYIMIINSLGNRELVPGENHPLHVDHKGSVQWIPATILQTRCRLDMTWFPFDEQTCPIRILSFRFSASEVTLSTTAFANLDNYEENGVWDLLRAEFIEQTDENSQTMILLSSTLRRLSSFMVFEIVVPVVVISLLNMAVFAVPAESGEKLSFGITVFLSQSVFITYVSSQMPRSSDPLSILSMYLTFVLLISALTVLITIWILKIHHTSEGTIPPLLRWIARLGRQKQEKLSKKKEPSTLKEFCAPEKNITWHDLSRGFDYILLRVFILVMVTTTGAFTVKLAVKDSG